MPQITGQALYEALLRACPDLVYTWRDLGFNDKQIYEQASATLNSQIATAQKQSGSALTGEDVAGCLGLKWDRFCTTAHTLYAEIATKINAQYITPLQGLVRDWQELLQAHDEMSIMSLTEIEDWHKDWENLKKRTRQLLDGEQKG